MDYIIIEKNKNITNRIISIIKMMSGNNYYHISSYLKITKNTFSSKTKDLNRIIMIDLDLVGLNDYALIKNESIKSNLTIVLYGNKEVIKPDVISNLYNINILIKDKSFFNNLYLLLINNYLYYKRNMFFSFSYNDEIINLSYDSIYYIEKNIYDNSITIFTKNDKYICYKTIKNTFDELKDDSRFIKTSRSSIVNLHKISYYNKCLNEIGFINGIKSYLISRDMKKELSTRIINNNSSIKTINKMI